MEENDLDRAIAEAEAHLAGQKRLLEILEKEFQEHVSLFEKKKKEISEELNRLTSLKESLSKAIKEQNEQELSCKKESLVSSVFGLAGVLAAPFSGGISLGLTFGSSLTRSHGIIRNYKSQKKLQEEAFQLMKQCSSLQEDLQKSFREIGSIIRSIEQIVRRSSDIITRRVTIIRCDFTCEPSKGIVIKAIIKTVKTGIDAYQKIKTNSVPLTVKGSRPTAFISKLKGVSKLGFTTGLLSIAFDIYDIANHEKEKQSETEEDIQNVIDECEKRLQTLDQFVKSPDITTLCQESTQTELKWI